MATSLDLDFFQDDLVRAVLFPFAKADYEGLDTVSINAVASSEVLQGADSTVVNEALRTAQWAGLIELDNERIGAIRLTQIGLAKFFLVRNDFFDADEVDQLRKKFCIIDSTNLNQSSSYKSIQSECLGLGALPGQVCPVAGRWFSRGRPDEILSLRAGDEIPGPHFDGEGKQIIWYLKKA